MTSNSINNYGPKIWYLIHTFAGKISFTNSNDYITFVHTLSDLLPCYNCRTHFKKLLEEFPVEPNMQSRHKLLYWSFIIHNKVNERLNKDIKIYPPVETYYLYKNKDREVDIMNKLWGTLFTIVYSKNTQRNTFIKFFQSITNMLDPYHRNTIEIAVRNMDNNSKNELHHLIYNIYKNVDINPIPFDIIDSFYKNAGCSL